MAVYISANRIKQAISRLGSSRAKRTPLFDFLIVKRTLALKGGNKAPITESEPSFSAALDELGKTDIADRARYFFNPFAVHEEGKTGYRPERYRSNGTNSTIAGVTWQSVIELSATKPRQASLKANYVDQLPALILASNAKPLPSLADLTAWYWRRQDIAPLVEGARTNTERMARLANELISRLRLTPQEMNEIFDQMIDEEEEELIFVLDQPSPLDYLPQKLTSVEASHESFSEVSFDLVSALAAKNFVILTGPSGTGKSRAALRLAEALQRIYSSAIKGSLFSFIPVGPDWTSPKRLLGYRTPFGKERSLATGVTTHESYEVTECVRLLLRASHSDVADVPHFLIFDEMNLSHVERYFAPFLSLMEASSIVDSDGELSLIDGDDLKVLSAVLDDVDPTSPEAESARTLLAEGRALLFPANLFCVGTVNIDDTTYMFSPKVLDRSHVIELASERPSTYLIPGQKQEPGGNMKILIGNQILKNAIEERESKTNSVSNAGALLDNLEPLGFSGAEIVAIREQTIKVLDGCYDLLSPVGFAFGYRASKEVFSYIVVWVASSLANGVDKATVLQNWPTGLDKAVIQKILPKLHGNRRALGDSLSALSAFLGGSDGTSTPAAAYTIGLNSRIAIAPEGKISIAESFKASREKLNGMHDRLNAVGFVSFVN